MSDVIPVVNMLATGVPANLDGTRPDSVWMEFSLDWINYKIHRVGETPLEIILSGTINTSNTVRWNLTTSDPLPNALPNLYFVEDVIGREGQTYEPDIPLIWEISLDEGEFIPMTLQPDNTLTTLFPPGQHNFQIRISGALEAGQEDGYYRLQLEQCLLPEL